MLKEFSVWYILDSDVKWERMIKKSNIKTEDVLQEVLKRMEHHKYFVAKTDKGSHVIHTSSIRYVRVFDEKTV